MLLIALLPALLAEFGMVAYFTTRTLTTAQDALHARAANATRHLAGTLPYALISGDITQITALLKVESVNSQLSFARISGPDGQQIASIGNPAPTISPNGHYGERIEIRLPAADLSADSLFVLGNAPTSNLLGHAEVEVSLEQISASKRDTLLHAALLMLGALVLTAALAWRLSNRLAGQLRHVGEVVERLACNELTVRTRLPPSGEVGALAAGVNNMAEALQRHQGELEKRITEATVDLAEKKEVAERAHHAKSRFFAAASHDLRQPMHALSLFVAALKGRNQQTETQALIDNIESSTAAMESLFNALLDISQLDAGVIEVHTMHFSLLKMFHQLDHQFRALAAEKNLKLHFRKRDITLYSDPVLIERILVNLIANAIRYTDSGGNVLVVCRSRGRMTRLSVIDTGRGILPDQQECVFHEFVQLHNPARDRSKGLGLGLAIVSRLGRLLGHRVALRSRLGHGSAFSIDVPCGNAHLIQQPAPFPLMAGQIPSDALVLLVDDESAILRGMAELFDNWRLDLITAYNADEAEHHIDDLGRVPDVIVSDYRLPNDTDGLQVIDRLRKKYGAHIPAILITGDTTSDTVMRISQTGISLLHKPLRPAKLRALLGHLIQRPHKVAVG